MTNIPRCFRIFDFSTGSAYSLEELYCTPFYQFCRREAWAAEAVYQLAVETISGERPKTFVPDVREHYVEEVGTPEMLKFYLQYRCISALKQDGKIVGSLVVMMLRKWDEIPFRGPLI